MSALEFANSMQLYISRIIPECDLQSAESLLPRSSQAVINLLARKLDYNACDWGCNEKVRVRTAASVCEQS